MTIICEEKNYRELKEKKNLKKLKKKLKKNYLIEEGIKIGIDEIIKHSEIINNILKSKI